MDAGHSFCIIIVGSYGSILVAFDQLPTGMLIPGAHRGSLLHVLVTDGDGDKAISRPHPSIDGQLFMGNSERFRV